MAIPFCKFHGFGNDYIVLEREAAGDASLDELARSMCHRHTGVGSDGLAILGASQNEAADFFCEIVNPDGSVAGFSGNGTRCAAAYLYHRKVWDARHLTLETRSGLKKFDLLRRPTETEYWFEAEIGVPKFAAADIPMLAATASETVDHTVKLDGRSVRISAVNVGNPVACMFVDEFPDDWRILGRALEYHDIFPERANIVFVKVIDRRNVELRIWERGAGETPASGTCSSGAAVLAAFLAKTERAVQVHSPGGITEVHWRDDGEIVLTGRADLAFCGEWPTPAR